MTILLSPHGDDETLFAAYTCLREKPHVIICTQDADQEVRRERTLETAAALEILGCTHHEWVMSADKPDWDKARIWLSSWDSSSLVASTADRVYAPAVHPDGHEQHNVVGELAREIFGDRVVSYMTYAPRGQRHIEGREIIPTTHEIRCKLMALACYRTQIENPSTRPWFFELLDLREWRSD
jgi:LmbE family N-acetylglucosaminyl deacetylase